MLLLIATGIVNAPVRRMVRAVRSETEEKRVLSRLERLAYGYVRPPRRDYDIDGNEAFLMTRSNDTDLVLFESHRALLVAHA